jgi:pyruvate/2-oxoglutarate/acetoin dehydrogenase E1 component
MSTLPDSRELTLGQAINEALHEEMANDSAVIVMGEDVGRHGGVFKLTQGL